MLDTGFHNSFAILLGFDFQFCHMLRLFYIFDVGQEGENYKCA